MDKFDQWYNKKMDEQKVFYSESSWDAFSQQLNQLPGSRKRRRPFLYIWVLALSVIIGAGSIFAWQAFNSPSAEQEILISTEKETDQGSPASNKKSDESNDANTSSEPLASTILPGSSEAISESSPLHTNGISGTTESKNTEVSSNNRAKHRSSTERSHATQQKASALNNDPIMQVAGAEGARKNNTISENQKNLTEAKSSEKSPSDATINAEDKLTEVTEIALTDEQEKSTESFENNEVATNLVVNQVLDPLNVELKSLEQNSILLTQSLMNDFNTLDPAIVPTIVDCCPFKGWSHHIETGVQFFPGVNEGSRFFTGLQASYHLQYRWAQRWSASAGAGILQRWGSFGGFQDSPQDIYTTTKVRRGFLLVPTAATYLQIPLMLNFHAGKHIISTGIRTHVLLGVKGQLDEYQLQRNGQQENLSFNSSTVNTGWINDSGFRSIVPEYMLSYGYQLNSHWSLSISAAWMPNGIVFADQTNENLDIQSILVADSGSSQQPFLLEDKWQAGISLRYKF